MSFAAGTPWDELNGTGVFPAGGTVTVPADDTRQWLYVMNRDTTEVTVSYPANYRVGGSGPSSPIALDPAAAAGRQGGIEERDATVFMPARATVIITGTAGKQVTILTA